VSIYKPYLPAILTLVGAVLVAAGLLLGQPQDAPKIFQWVRLAGAIMAAIGSFWAAHRQVVSAAENRRRDERLLDLTDQVLGQTTGGSSFCYARPQFGIPPSREFGWVVIHEGKFPLYDLSVRIVSLDQSAGPGRLIGNTHRIGTMVPGTCNSLPGDICTENLSAGFNLFFFARNGAWTQEIRWKLFPKVALATAIRVQGGVPGRTNPMLLEISPEFPEPLSNQENWNKPPPYGGEKQTSFEARSLASEGGA
jgi:hypothetical protein